MASHWYPIRFRTAMARYMDRNTGPETVRRLRDFTLELQAARIANDIADRMEQEFRRGSGPFWDAPNASDEPGRPMYRPEN